MNALFQRIRNKSQGLYLRSMSLADQVCFAAANFILTITLARFYSESEIAGFGVGVSVAIIIQGTLRNLYVVQNSVLASAIFQRRVDKVMGQHLIIWSIIIAAEFIIAFLLQWFSPDAYHQAILISIVTCSLIFAQLDFDRVVLIKHEKYKDPFIASGFFLVLNLILFFAAPYWGLSFLTIMFLIAGYAVTKIVRLIFLVGKPNFFWGWRLAKKSISRNSFGTMTGIISSTGFGHVPIFVLSSVTSPIHSAAFVAMRAIIQPLNVIIRALDVIDKNTFQHSGIITPLLMRQIILKQSIVYAALSAFAFLGTLGLGREILSLIYGNRYDDFFSVLVGFAFLFTISSMTYPLETALVRMNLLNRYNYLRLLAGALGVILSVLLCPTFGALGAVMASIGGWVASFGIALWLLRDLFLTRR